MKRKSTSRRGAVLAVAAVALSVFGAGLAGSSTATAASSAGWCNGKKSVTFPSGAKGNVPTYNGKTNCTMSRGSVGTHVEVLQRTLRDCYGQRISVDGEFGPATQKALKSAQNLTDSMYPEDIDGDGIYGPITAKYLSHYATKSGKLRCSSLHG